VARPNLKEDGYLDMKKEARVLIVEDDPFAQNWIALLLARDWRTRSVGKVDSLEAMRGFFASPAEMPNCVVINAELLGGEPATGAQSAAGQPANGQPATGQPVASQSAAFLSGLPGGPLIILIGRTVPASLPSYLPFPGFGGFLIRNEIGDGLSWAVALADTGQWVITPGMAPLARALRPSGQPPAKILVLDGRESIHNLTEHEAEVARMALIYSMERRELSDELKITPDWSYGLVSTIYQKLGMDEILSGEIDAEEFLGKSFTETRRFKETVRQAQNARRNDLESLAFHIFTMPEITELD
jgi:hypothetical protein